MTYQIVRILLVGMLPLSSFGVQEVHSGGHGYTYVVKGRVVDDRGNPVPRAEVALQPTVRAESWESWIPHHIADAKGRFRIEETSSLQTQERILYVISPLPRNADAPVTPPFRELGSTDEIFAGRRIMIKKNEELDVGNVSLQVRYGLTLIRLLDHSASPIFGESTKDDNLPKLWLRVRDARGDVASEGGIGRDAFRKSESTIAVALPEGRWQLELAEDSNTMKWHGLDKELFIQPATRPLEVILKLPEGGWSSATTRPSKVYDAKVARRELDRRGIAYTEETFVERARTGNINIVEIFLAAGMDPNARGKSGCTGLMAAARSGFGDIVQALLNKHADVNATDNDGATALMIAAGGFDSDIVKLLVEKGAEVNAKSNNGLTVLIFAVANDHLANVKLLLAAGADVNVKDNGGKTALTWAAESGRTHIVELLKKAQARN